MPLTPSLVCCIAILLNSSVLFQFTEAFRPPREGDRTILSYNTAADPCIHVSDLSPEEKKTAADRICRQAFLGLDQNNANSCRGWREPACRLLPGFSNRQCSCLVSIRNHSGIGSDESKSFRRCALDLRPDRYFTGEITRPSGFQELLRTVETSATGAMVQTLRNSLNVGGSNGGSTSYVPNTAYAGDLPFGSSSQYKAGTSRRNTDRAGGKTFQCPFCLNVYKTASAWRDHKRSHTEDVTCRICNQKYASKTNFEKHVKDVHHCTEAVALGKDWDSYQRAVEAYNKSKPHLCRVCGKRFSWVKSFTSHMASHDSQATFCTLCKKTYSTRSNLLAHMREWH